MRLLLVEDEIKLSSIISATLTKKGYAVDTLADGNKAMRRISLNHMDYDLFILDLNLPGKLGTEIVAETRKLGIDTPVLILTASTDMPTKIQILSDGADDVMTKPFYFDELIARIQAILRRPRQTLQNKLIAGPFVIDQASHTATQDDVQLFLTLKEFTLLEYFMINAQRVVTRDELLTHLWDFNYSSFSNVVDVHVKNLRKKLNIGNGFMGLETIRGIGYKFMV